MKPNVKCRLAGMEEITPSKICDICMTKFPGLCLEPEITTIRAAVIAEENRAQSLSGQAIASRLFAIDQEYTDLSAFDREIKGLIADIRNKDPDLMINSTPASQQPTVCLKCTYPKDGICAEADFCKGCGHFDSFFSSCILTRFKARVGEDGKQEWVYPRNDPCRWLLAVTGCASDIRKKQSPAIQPQPDPCHSCKYSKQACAYIMDGRKEEDACMEKKVWLKWSNRHTPAITALTEVRLTIKKIKSEDPADIKSMALGIVEGKILELRQHLPTDTARKEME